MAILEVNNLVKNFGRTHVLRGVSFSMEQGQVLSVIGSSGSGKTTLLRCLNSLETPDEGTVTVAGETLFDAAITVKRTEAQVRYARRRFGLVFQQFNLFPQYTVKKNVTLAEELLAREQLKAKGEYRGCTDLRSALAAIGERADKLLADVGLSHKAGSYPDQLSGGQQQRVAIARALALDPPILCFDEPTSALDPELTGEVLRVIRELKTAGRTMIVVTHEIGFARDVSDTVLFMDGGVIAESGPPAQVIDNPQTPRAREFLSRFYEQ